MNKKGDVGRDMDISSFGKILKDFCDSNEGIETVIFYDNSGETIDYHTLIDPYSTRLTAAHHGVIFEMIRARLGWLNMGNIERIEICTTERESVTIRVGDDSFITVVTQKGIIDDKLQSALKNTALLLFNEAGY